MFYAHTAAAAAAAKKTRSLSRKNFSLSRVGLKEKISADEGGVAKWKRARKKIVCPAKKELMIYLLDGGFLEDALRLVLL
jgi:hypothetical protein